MLENSYICSIANNAFLLSHFQNSLWFAWKLVHLQYRKQQWRHLRFSPKSCDLLENSYICSIANNTINYTTSIVVLWFAWKLVHLQYRKQQNIGKAFIDGCCDLLENSYICSIANNLLFRKLLFAMVVICLKTRTFAVSQTTHRGFGLYWQPLWFAWKLVHLQYRKQHYRMIRHRGNGCDLLENSYICSIANNELLNTNHHP